MPAPSISVMRSSDTPAPHPSSLPSSILFAVRFLHPAALLTASFFSYCLPTILYFLAFLAHHFTPHYAILLSRYPARYLLASFIYSLLNILAHIALAILIATSVINPSNLPSDVLLSLAVPRYDLSPWQGLRFLIPHLLVLFSSLFALLVRIPPDHYYSGKRFIFAWFARRRALSRKKEADELLHKTPALPNLSHAHDLDDDHHSFTDDLDISIGTTMPKRSHILPVNKFTYYVVHRAGLFWSALSIALVGMSYSSLLTFVFLATFFAIISGWAYRVKSTNPLHNPTRYLRLLRTFRFFVVAYLVLLLTYQLPWLVKYSSSDATHSSVLRLFGFVPLTTDVVGGWAYVMGFAAAVTTFVITGVFESSLRTVSKAIDAQRSEASVESEMSDEGRAASSVQAKHRPSYYELQFLLIIVHTSSIGLLTWALVFPGLLTFPLLLASLVYLSMKHYRNSLVVNYIGLYGFILHMVHYLFLAVCDAFNINDGQDSAVVRLLGLGGLTPQFSVNVIETVTVALLGVNVFSKHYLAEVKALQEGVGVRDAGRSLDIEEFVHWSLFSSKSRNRDSLYTPLKLTLDQLALASLYVAGAVDITGLNAVFLVGLSILCILQSFGLFRKPRIFFLAWTAVFLYSMAILLITGVFCRAVDSIWTCNLENEGIKSVSRGQVVAYAAVVALASLQINFTWPYNTEVQPDFVKSLDTRFWRALRRYFLYVSYGSLLLYPLIFPANFVSYAYFFFLFLSICVELIILSFPNRSKEIRELVSKYWIAVILYACGAMLSRYSVRLEWINNDEATKWIFGVSDEDSRKFAITFGDAILLIIISLQKRLFVAEKLVEQELPDEVFVEDNKKVQRDPVEDPIAARHFKLQDLPELLDAKPIFRGAAVPKHRRYKSMEEYLNEKFTEELRSILPSNNQKKNSLPTSRSQSIPENLNLLAIPEPDSAPQNGNLEKRAHSSRERDMASSHSDTEQEEAQMENEGRGNRAGMDQALQMFRNFRKSVPVKQTEKFLLELYTQALVVIRGIVLKYSYVLQALAILAASVWLPGISVFGAIYIILGCIIMLSEQTTIHTRNKGNTTQLIAKTMPATLVILSFSLLSAQYIFLIVHFMDKVDETAVTTYLGLQTPSEPGPLPITVDAMIAHVLVFVTAAMQRVAVQWARIDAEKLREEERGLSQLRSSSWAPDGNTEALDIAVPIESVIEGAGGQNKSSDGRQERHGAPFPVDWVEMRTWNTDPKMFALYDSEGSESSLPAVAMSSETSDGRRSELDRIEKFRGQFYKILRELYQHTGAIISLLVPFWSYWGFDVTFTYLIFCGAITTTVFSVVYVIIVLLACGLRRSRIRKHWHQVTLLLAVLVLCQYFLTLGIPPSSMDDASEGNEDSSPWEQWLLLDRDNTSRERKLAITFAFLAVICAGITLNSVSDSSRRLRYWLASLEESKDERSQISKTAVPIPGEGHLAESHSESIEGQFGSSLGVSLFAGADSQPLVERSLDSQGGLENQPSLLNFISGLGLPRSTGIPQKLPSEVREEIAQGISADGLVGGEGAFKLTKSTANILSGHRDDQIEASVDGVGMSSSKDLKQVEKSIFSKVDPDDFTRRPMAFKNRVKLACMRFTGPLIQLYIFAVASVDTNVFSAVLLGLAFSFIFQFAKIEQKKRRFEIVRRYVSIVILALVLFQAPFEVTSETGWESIVGLLKKDTDRGESVLYLLVSLWILCQIQGRIYESQGFRFVEQYSLEDAKVRFKRAVHEHNGRKYEKMLGRNKSERSLLARKSRLQRLKILQKSERTVDAFYDVCVRQEVELLRKMAASTNSDANKFGSHRFPEEEESEQIKPESLSISSRFVRRLLRGRTWKLHISDPLKSEVKSFIMRYSAWPVYATMLLAAIANPSVPTLIYPIVIFLYFVVEQPRPPKQAWTLLMGYVCVTIAVKYVFRSPSWSFCADVPFFALNENNRIPSVTEVDNCATAAGIGFDILVLLALLGHRAVLYTRGIWDLPMSEEDMLLRSEIRGRECETPLDMEYNEDAPDQSNDTHRTFSASLNTSQKSGRSSGNHIWDAEQQYEDVEHILSQARRDILGESREQVRFAPTVQIVPPSRRSRRNSTSSDLKQGKDRLSHDLESFANVFEYGGDGTTAKQQLVPSSSEEIFKASRLPMSVGDRGSEIGRDARSNLFDKPLITIPPNLEKKQVTNTGSASKDFWDRTAAQQSNLGSWTVPQSAPVITSRSEVGGPPSVQGSDRMRNVQALNRFRSFRFGALRGNPTNLTPGHTSPRPLTAGQSRVQEALIQSKIIPSQRGYGTRSLTLFQVEERGFFSRIRNYFLRLTRENDHKTVGDYYLLTFIVDFISFVYVMFGFSAIFGETNSERAQAWWITNFIETRHLLTLFAMFMSLILDRTFYLTRNMTGKLILQYTSVIVYHVVLFLIQDLIGTRFATRIFYILRCIYFLLSGLQIRDGFPLYTTAQFLLRNYTTLGIVMFEIYIFVPFLWLSRTLLDWTVLPTSLEIFQYFRFIDIYLWLYRNRAVNMSRGAFRRKLGEKRRLLPRIYQGVGLFLLCVIALFLPFMIFSIFNPFFVSRELRSAVVSVDLLTFDGNIAAEGNSYEIFSRTAIVGNELSAREREDAARAIGVKLDLREKENVFQAFFNPISESIWQTPEDDRQTLVRGLRSFANEESGEAPQFAFTLSTSTKDGTTFGTRQRVLSLNMTQANDLADAVSSQENFAMVVVSPLSRYSILQSGSNVFESFPPEEGTRPVCIRLIQSNQVSFWTMGDCPQSGCSCGKDSALESTNREIRHILQIADISALQVGGATILTLYTAILFTIANLLKRFFIDKRLIIPYIDMPYTLHLYQLVLDIMYARQDKQLEMEEILYNGLIDIYRDQRELVRWTGERALKIPSVWWDKSETDDPFMAYPAFAETATEPYIERKVE